jgi:hypothetical protein
MGICKECSSLSRKEKAKTNKKYLEYQKEYRFKNKDKIKEQCKRHNTKNKEKISLKQKEYRKNNPKKYKQQYIKPIGAAKRAKRRAQETQATLRLTQFDIDYIKHLYIQSKELEKLDGIKRHIDHIVPLRGKTVCGLHVPWNLQILTAEENLKKSNILDD